MNGGDVRLPLRYHLFRWLAVTGPIARIALVLLLVVVGYLTYRDRTESHRVDDRIARAEEQARQSQAQLCGFVATVDRELTNVDRYPPSTPAGSDLQHGLTRIRSSAGIYARSPDCQPHPRGAP